MASSHSPLPEIEPTDSELTDASEIEIAPVAPDYSIPPTKLEQLKSSKWRPVAALAGGLLIGGILMPLIISSGNTRGATSTATASWSLALPASSTMLTEMSAAPGKPIRGQISPVADITGKAPVGGAVARWVVQPGEPVQAGQPVVQISSGAASAAPLPGESRQIEAENQQTAAAGDQVALSKRLTTTQEKLAAAQERVERAQENIAKTRAIIARMRTDGAPALPAVPAPRRKPAAPKSDAKVNAARDAVGGAQAAYDDTKAQLSTARADLSAAQKSLAPLQSKVDETQANVKTIEGKFDGSLASASDVQAARSARDNAKSTLKSASDRLLGAQKAIPNLEAKLATRESALDDAKRAQRSALANSNSSAATDNATDETPAPVASTGNAISIDQAAKLVDDALAESRAATREADRLRKLIDTYQAQAQTSNQRITKATENLQNAQQNSQERMVQAVPRVRFTAASAPASGTVVWIATLAREVGPGQSVFGLASGKTYRARFEDVTDNWRGARVGQIVNALLAPPAPVAPAPVAPAPVAPAPVAATKPPSANDAGSPPMPVLVSPAANTAATPAVAAPAGAQPAATATPELDANNAAGQGAVPVKVRLTRIAPPEGAGQPAILEGELVSGSNTAGPNYRLLAALPSVGAPDILAVPEAALVQRDGAWMVAVIEPDSEPQTEVTPVATVTPAPAPAVAPDETTAGTLSWRVVKVGESDGITRRVSDGLKAGERIITDPLPLIAQAPPESQTMPKVKLS